MTSGPAEKPSRVASPPERKRRTMTVMDLQERDRQLERLARRFRHSKDNFWIKGRYERQALDAEHEQRMRWWREARLGLFIHFGLYSLLGRGEWVMHNEMICPEEYEKLADSFHPKPGCMRDAVQLAAESGMRYAVLSTKHHDGYCLWDTSRTDFNAVKRGPGFDLVREFTDACHQRQLRAGLYYSLMDWRHPDGDRCKDDKDARKRFVDFTRGCIEELLTNYGRIDVLWLDVPSPLSPEQWGAEEMVARARELQPGILINDRFGLPADFATPEEGVVVAEPGRDWEVCMTTNHNWGYAPEAQSDYRGIREVLRVLYQSCAHQGNFLLNLGPAPDGSIPDGFRELAEALGRWIDRNGPTVFGRFPRLEEFSLWRPSVGDWVVGDERTLYLWCRLWPGQRLTIAALESAVDRVTLLSDGQPREFTQDDRHVVVRDLPAENPDPESGLNVFAFELAEPIRFE
jgi:alpha-L-fucosidase